MDLVDKELVIANIPIYSMSKIRFEKKWECFKKYKIKNYIEHGLSEEKAMLYTNESVIPFSLWKYNQIIGYITIVLKEYDNIYFEIYKPDTKTFRYDSKTKHFMINKTVTGMHFKITDEMTNEIIIEQITRYIENYKKNYLNKNMFIDLDNFKLISKFIDYKFLIKNFENL